MYLPSIHEEKDIAKLHAVIESKPLATWVGCHKGVPVVNHVPFLLDKTKGKFGTLIGHVARANSDIHAYLQENESTLVFHGEQAYRSPSWYPSKSRDPRVVPTWNYVVVHAHGTATSFQDSNRLKEHVEALTQVHEAKQSPPWQVSDAPEAFVRKLTKAIVGIEIPITKLVGKWKIGQNRCEEDQKGTRAGLAASADSSARALYSFLPTR